MTRRKETKNKITKASYIEIISVFLQTNKIFIRLESWLLRFKNPIFFFFVTLTSFKIIPLFASIKSRLNRWTLGEENDFSFSHALSISFYDDHLKLSYHLTETFRGKIDLLSFSVFNCLFFYCRLRQAGECWDFYRLFVTTYCFIFVLFFTIEKYEYTNKRKLIQSNRFSLRFV